MLFWWRALKRFGLRFSSACGVQCLKDTCTFQRELVTCVCLCVCVCKAKLVQRAIQSPLDRKGQCMKRPVFEGKKTEA